MKSLSDLWDSILSRLSGELSDTTIKTWFDEISVVTMEDSALVLHCSNAFKKNTVEARFLPQIKAALKDIFSTDMEVKILSDEQLAAYHGVAPDRPGDLFDSDAFTFETYVVGPQNKLAYAAAKSVAEKPAESYNPLFIYGDSGLGKTHLLYAIAHLVNRRRPEARIVYIKGDDFTNELVSSIRENRNAEFREKVEREGFGVNVVPGDAEGLAKVICELVEDEAGRARMGHVARELAVAQFDRPHSYEATVDLIRSLIAERSK